jgi:molybdate transport system regulatory protein
VSSAADDPFEVRGTLWLTLKGASFGGAGRIDLLTRIAEYGSINRAAKSMRMSYRAAWEAIDTMNDLAGEALPNARLAAKAAVRA